jgi:trans-aconitate methyltransferase
VSAFEERYAADPDPWRTLSDPYELDKARRTLDACGPGPFAAACELGAGIGALTVRLAPRCRTLVTLDDAPTAVAAARRRLAAFPYTEARVARVPDDLPSALFDLVVASEILYYLEDGALLTTVAWAETALVPGGRLVAVHWTGSAPDLRRDAGEVAQELRASRRLRPVPGAGGTFPGFRLDVLERVR